MHVIKVIGSTGSSHTALAVRYQQLSGQIRQYVLIN
jgi:ribosomal protein S28E/S33